MYSLSLFLLSWLVAGLISGILKVCDKDFYEIHQKALNESGLNTENPKLFAIAMSILFGYYALYIELKYRLTNKIK